MRLTSGTRLGPYEIIDALGAGGMGEVYRARDSRLRRDVAIKVVHSAEADRVTWERFEREARAASALSHPNICTVFDTGEADGQPYLVMELLEGQTLKDRIGSQPIESTAAVAIAVQIADALEAAHAKGILHRDIKPGNVMIIGRGHVKVLDFGLAKQTTVGETDETVTLRTETQAGHVMGTPAYLSPEVLKGSKADARSDLWAFGVVMYQMLSGRLPFQGTTTLEMSSGILKETPPPLTASVPPKLRAIVERCLEKSPEKRYQNAGEIRMALEGMQTVSATPKQKGRTWLWVAGAAAIVVVAGGLAWQQQAGSSVRTLSTGGPVSVNPEANQLFEMAVNFLQVQNDNLKGRETLERALALDPNFVEAHRYHAFQLATGLLNGFTNDTSELFKAEEELNLVARQAPGLFSLPSAQTAVYWLQGNKALVPIQRLDEVLQQHPSHVETSTWRVMLHMMSEENTRAQEIARKALDMESLSAPMRMLQGELLRTELDFAGAIREERRVLEHAPRSISAIWCLTMAYLDTGQTDEARSLLLEKRPFSQDNYMWRHAWALVLAAGNQREEAIQTMDAGTQDFARAVFRVTSETAAFYASIGDTASAVKWIDRAVRNGDERVGWFRRNPRLASIQKDPDFLRIVAQIEARRKR